MSIETEKENYHDLTLQTEKTDSEDVKMKTDDSKTSEIENSIAEEVTSNGESGSNAFMENFMTEESNVVDRTNEDFSKTRLSNKDTVEAANDTGIVPVVIDNVETFLKQYPEQNLNQMPQSLREIQKYRTDSSSSSSSDDDSEEDSEGSESENDSSSEDDSSSESDSSSGDDSSSDDDSSSEKDSDSKDKIKKKKVRGRVLNTNKKNPQEEPPESWLSILGIDKMFTELPDISSLDLNDEEEFVHMGVFEHVIDNIVTVNALPQMPAYDLDTLLFLEEGKKVLGYVVDVMGPVTLPTYIIPMTSAEVLEDLQLQKGTKVYCAPKSKYTKYIVLEELMQNRGSDASWVGDAEIPPELQEYSDDEQERANKASKKNVKRKRTQDNDAESIHNMDRLPGGRAPPVTNSNIYQTQNLGMVNRTPMEGPRQFRSTLPNVGATMYRQPNHLVVNPFAGPNLYNFPMVPIFNPSVPPPNFRAPIFAPLVGHRFPPPYFGVNAPPPPQNFNPRGHM